LTFKSINSGGIFIGLKNHIGYISDLGVKTVILSQFQNPTNLKEVDPAFGTLESLKELIAAFKDKKGEQLHLIIRLCILKLNQTETISSCCFAI